MAGRWLRAVRRAGSQGRVTPCAGCVSPAGRSSWLRPSRFPLELSCPGKACRSRSPGDGVRGCRSSDHHPQAGSLPRLALWLPGCRRVPRRFFSQADGWISILPPPHMVYGSHVAVACMTSRRAAPLNHRAMRLTAESVVLEWVLWVLRALGHLRWWTRGEVGRAWTPRPPGEAGIAGGPRRNTTESVRVDSTAPLVSSVPRGAWEVATIARYAHPFALLGPVFLSSMEVFRGGLPLSMASPVYGCGCVVCARVAAWVLRGVESSSGASSPGP